MDGLIALQETAPTSVHIPYYAANVLAHSDLRNKIALANEALRVGLSSERSISERSSAIDMLFTSGRQISERRGRMGERLRPIGEDAEQVAEHFGTLDHHTGLLTGWPDWDILTGGLHPGDLTVIAARPSVGKTALILALAIVIARQGHKVAIFSLEMSRQELQHRLISMISGVNLQKVIQNRLNDDQRAAVFDAIGELAMLPLVLCDESGINPFRIETMCRRSEADDGQPVELVIIDYMQLQEWITPVEDDTRRVSLLSRQSKQLARNLHAPVIAVSQLNRGVEDRTVKVPVLSDLRASGSIEQDANNVVFLYRDELYNPRSEKRGIIELHYAKHRNGPVGVISLRYTPKNGRFASCATAAQRQQATHYSQHEDD
jgi:replicative DNA helicase